MPASAGSCWRRLARPAARVSALAAAWALAGAVAPTDAQAAPRAPLARPAAVAVRMSARLAPHARAGVWTTLRIVCDNHSRARTTVSFYTGFRDTGLVRAGRVRLERGRPGGGWRELPLSPGDEEYFAVDRAEVLAPGVTTAVYRLLVTSGPGTLHVRILMAAGVARGPEAFRHPAAAFAGLVTVANPRIATTVTRAPVGAPTPARRSAAPTAVASARPTVAAATAQPAVVTSSAAPLAVGSSAPGARVSPTPRTVAIHDVSRHGPDLGLIASVAGVLFAATAATVVALRRSRRG